MNTAELTRLILRTIAAHNLSSSELLLLLTVVDRGNPTRDNGEFKTWVSAEKLGLLAGLSRPTAYRALSSIKKSTLPCLIVTKRQHANGLNNTNIYTVNPAWVESMQTASINMSIVECQEDIQVVSKQDLDSVAVTPKEDNLLENNTKEKNSTYTLDFLLSLKSYDSFYDAQRVGAHVHKGMVYRNRDTSANPIGFMADNCKVCLAIQDMINSLQSAVVVEDELAAIAA